MQLCKVFLNSFFQNKKFSFYTKIDLIFKKIFKAYASQVIFIKLKDNIFYIGVLAVQFICHFNAIKNDIKNELISELPDVEILDIKFFYYKKKDLLSNNNKKVYQNDVNVLIDKIYINTMIQKNCKNKDLHDLLYRIYFNNVKK